MTNQWLCITLGTYFTEILVDASSPKKQTTLLLLSKKAHSTNLRRQAGHWKLFQPAKHAPGC